ncbi:MAG TPA: type VI secretion system baseplate subunit TssG [Arenibaculum sp.]|nr:type VI secretion system baseplate subunit TssG [Arenibaculum sp.]
MATSGWRTNRSVATQLFTQGHRFDFYQVVRLLELIDAVSARVGEGSDPAVEPVRFRSSLTSAFPASDVEHVSMPDPGDTRFAVRVNFMGLAGAFGPLPPPLADLIAERARRQDHAGSDFLDIFNHRLVSLMYRARSRHRAELNRCRPDETNFAFYLYSLLGLGTGGLRGRMAVADRTLLHHAGLLNQQPRSLHGLERLLEDHFDVHVRGVPLQGRWLPLGESQVTRLGRRHGRNRMLGRDAVLGTRAWDQQAAVTLVLGPLDLDRFVTFLPVGDAWAPLVALFRFHAGTDLEGAVRLRLRASQVPASCLSRGAGPRLGWTSWLTTRPSARPPARPPARLRTCEGVVTLRLRSRGGPAAP